GTEAWESPARALILPSSDSEIYKTTTMNSRAETPRTTHRHQHGFARTVCDCPFCQAPCKHIPGSLDVADLTRLCPPEKDIFAWAEDHLRAVVDKRYPTLVPAHGINGGCHWLFDGKCVVHEDAPYSCGFFDMHMTDAEIERRMQATIKEREEDA